VSCCFFFFTSLFIGKDEGSRTLRSGMIMVISLFRLEPVYCCISKAFLEKIELNFIFFLCFKLIFLMFSYHFDVLMSKIIFLKKIILMYFLTKILWQTTAIILSNTLLISTFRNNFTHWTRCSSCSFHTDFCSISEV